MTKRDQELNRLNEKAAEYIKESLHQLAPEEIVGDEFKDRLTDGDLYLIMSRLLQDYNLFMVETSDIPPEAGMKARRIICPFCTVEVKPEEHACKDCAPKQLPGYELAIAEGDTVSIQSQGTRVTGIVSSAHYYQPDRDRDGNVQGGGWYIELTKANTPGGVSYWKQGCDGGRVVMVNGLTAWEINPR